MRTTIAAISLAGAIGIAGCQSAGAVAVDAAAIKEAESAASTVQQARFYGHATVTTSSSASGNSSSARMFATASIVYDGKAHARHFTKSYTSLSPTSSANHPCTVWPVFGHR